MIGHTSLHCGNDAEGLLNPPKLSGSWSWSSPFELFDDNRLSLVLKYNHSLAPELDRLRTLSPIGDIKRESTRETVNVAFSTSRDERPRDLRYSSRKPAFHLPHWSNRPVGLEDLQRTRTACVNTAVEAGDPSSKARQTFSRRIGRETGGCDQSNAEQKDPCSFH